MRIQVGAGIGSYQMALEEWVKFIALRGTKLNRDVAIKVLPAALARNVH